MLKLEITKRTDVRLLERMKIHYSQPKGFVGRSICYAISYNETYYGHIVAGSSTRFLPNRNEYFGIEIKDLRKVINNIFFNICKVDCRYPVRNFSSLILREFVKQTTIDWYDKYGDDVVGFESLVELPRSGECYLRAGWKLIGQTKGYTCKRTSGKGTDSWSGKRVWNTKELKSKLVFVKKI